MGLFWAPKSLLPGQALLQAVLSLVQAQPWGGQHGNRAWLLPVGPRSGPSGVLGGGQGPWLGALWRQGAAFGSEEGRGANRQMPVSHMLRPEVARYLHCDLCSVFRVWPNTGPGTALQVCSHVPLKRSGKCVQETPGRKESRPVVLLGGWHLDFDVLKAVLRD